jgi:Zn-dependent M28 family amino/carboxypeptidase
VEPTLLSEASLRTAGILLLAVVTIEFGGTFLLRVARGSVPATDLQRRFFRAGHAHAGVLVLFALATQPFVDAAGLTGLPGVVARSGIGAAAILMSAGFFLSVSGRDVTRPNRLIVLLWAGAAVLAAGVVTLGVGLLAA